VEHAFSEVEGVTETAVGYMGGNLDNPKYEDVCTNKTGHAEVVQVQFDHSKITFQQLLDVFFDIHDPTQVNRQGQDVGSQYRSVIFYHSKEQKVAAEEKKAYLDASLRHSEPIATAIETTTTFWPAEKHHQKYFQKNPNYACNVKR
jgi:peptide-methionine (S)-S-oxide reductase